MQKTVRTPSETTFSHEERVAFLKKKWRREHVALFAVLSLLVLAAILLPLVLGRPHFIGLAPLVGVIAYGYQNNKMMGYVEYHLYD